MVAVAVDGETRALLGIADEVRADLRPRRCARCARSGSSR